MTKIFNQGYDMTYIMSLEAANRNEFDIKRENISDGIIEFKVGASLFSFEEKFVITVKMVDAKQTSVTVSSVGAVRLQLIDWGKNIDNIENFFMTLNNLLK